MSNPASPEAVADRAIVTAEQMRQIEGRLFAAGLPVAALMEKVAGLITRWVQAHFLRVGFPSVGVLVGPGHNGGDALVVARELHLSGYQVQIYAPFSRLKDLTEQHARYAASLGIPFAKTIAALEECSFFIDGLFGFGLERPLTGELATTVEALNRSARPCISIDLPSGIETDSGKVLGAAIRATHTLCLGLWKQAFFQDQALPYVGSAERIDFGIPAADIEAVLGQLPAAGRLTAAAALQRLPLPRSLTAHKYKAGHLLLVAGSRQYGGAALLAGLGARGSGVGMLTLALPESLRGALHSQLPEALLVGCPETESGAIVRLPDGLDLAKYDAIACGPGLSQGAGAAIEQVLAADAPLLLDADGLNLLAAKGAAERLRQRAAPTLLTPHPGEFKRLFPDLAQFATSGEAALAAARQSGAVVILKGARSAIASPQGELWYLASSTPALARGGSGDVLTGLTGGLMAGLIAAAKTAGLDHPLAEFAPARVLDAALAGAWWHAAAAQAAAAERTALGVDPLTLSQYLTPTLARFMDSVR